jgi:hypothetical protein
MPCRAEIEGLRSFKCHKLAYAIGDIAQVIERLEAGN